MWAELVKNRYESWDNGIGAAIEADKEDFNSLEKYALSKPDPMQYDSGRQELLENIRAATSVSGTSALRSSRARVS